MEKSGVDEGGANASFDAVEAGRKSVPIRSGPVKPVLEKAIQLDFCWIVNAVDIRVHRIVLKKRWPLPAATVEQSGFSPDVHTPVTAHPTGQVASGGDPPPISTWALFLSSRLGTNRQPITAGYPTVDEPTAHVNVRLDEQSSMTTYRSGHTVSRPQSLWVTLGVGATDQTNEEGECEVSCEVGSQSAQRIAHAHVHRGIRGRGPGHNWARAARGRR